MRNFKDFILKRIEYEQRLTHKYGLEKYLNELCTDYEDLYPNRCYAQLLQCEACGYAGDLEIEMPKEQAVCPNCGASSFTHIC